MLISLEMSFYLRQTPKQCNHNLGEICNSEKKKKKFRENEKSDRDRRRMHLRGCRTSCSLLWDGKDGGLLSIDFQDIAMTPLQGIGGQ